MNRIFRTILYFTLILCSQTSYSADPVWNLRAGHAGLSTGIHLEKGISANQAIGIGYTRFLGKTNQKSEVGIVPGLHQISVDYVSYLESDRFATGWTMRLSGHVTQLDKNADISSIEIESTRDENDFIRSGETIFGGQGGFGHEWHWENLSFSMQTEYLIAGKLQTWIPLSLWAGISF